MSNDYSKLFINDKVKTWFNLGKEYDNMTVGLKKELPAKILFDATLAQKKLKELSKGKDNDKKQDAINSTMKQLYSMARTYLENVLDQDNIRVITNDVLDQLGIEETIEHFRKIRDYQSKSVEASIKK